MAEAAQRRNSIDDLYTDNVLESVRLAYLLTGDRNLAEDIVQDAFVKLTGRYHHVRNPEAFPVYLRRTIVNLARGHWRRLRVEREYLRRQVDRPEASRMPDVETSSALRDALMQLSPKQRAAIVLRYYYDQSEEQTAETLECSVHAVKSLVHRGMVQLRHHVGAEK
jgi:RNA polymerase sigma-70 factor (sigma-E family)